VHFYEKEKERHNQEVSAALERAGYNVNGIDLWIGIYRPDRPFASKMASGDPARPIADIIIRNDLAKDK